MDDSTQDSDIDPQYFTNLATKFCADFEKELFKDPMEAGAFLKEVDGFVDETLDILKVREEAANPGLILTFGSAIGEALRALLNQQASWVYSVRQQRWVIFLRLIDGSDMEWNVFHKIEKRFQNGAEDSILYWVETAMDIIRKRDMEYTQGT